ncbi:hypothetical protein ACQCVB_11075 [Fictibacillus phosphorivorans]|uniref:hypothetical protein n=1 Tax=Fictibacillus phosphorivorans TaxID=1221500 RepID=UPI003CFAD9D2
MNFELMYGKFTSEMEILSEEARVIEEEALTFFDKYKNSYSHICMAYHFFGDDGSDHCRGRYNEVKKIMQCLPDEEKKVFLKYAVKAIKKNMEWQRILDKLYLRKKIRHG